MIWLWAYIFTCLNSVSESLEGVSPPLFWSSSTPSLLKSFNIINEMPQLLQIKTVYLNSRATPSGNIGERTLTSGQTEKVNLWSKIKMVHPWIRQCAIPHCHDPLPINIIPWERPYQYTSSYWVSTYLGGCVLTFLLSSAADIHSSLDLLTFSGTMARGRERERKREREREIKLVREPAGWDNLQMLLLTSFTCLPGLEIKMAGQSVNDWF